MTETDIQQKRQSRAQFVIGVVLFLAIIAVSAALIITSVTDNNLPQDTIEDSAPVDIPEETEGNRGDEAIDETLEPSIPEETEDIPEETEDIACDDKVVDEETEPTPEPTVEPETTPDVTELTEPPETKPTEPETTEPATEDVEADPQVDPEALELLACVIYQEAGGNYYCDECRRRVADVVLNRVSDDRYPDTIHGVLTQYRQYGKFYWTGVVWPERAKYEADSVARAYRIAEEVLSGQHSELYGNGYIYQAEFVQGKDNIYCCSHYFGK